MTNWFKRQRECNECGGSGFKPLGERSIVRCKCQPRTTSEIAEAAKQEATRLAKRGLTPDERATKRAPARRVNARR